VQKHSEDRPSAAINQSIIYLPMHIMQFLLFFIFEKNAYMTFWYTEVLRAQCYAVVKRQKYVFCSICAMLDGTVCSSAQLTVIEKHLQETVKQGLQSTHDVRITVTFIPLFSSFYSHPFCHPSLLSLSLQTLKILFCRNHSHHELLVPFGLLSYITELFIGCSSSSVLFYSSVNPLVSVWFGLE